MFTFDGQRNHKSASHVVPFIRKFVVFHQPPPTKSLIRVANYIASLLHASRKCTVLILNGAGIMANLTQH
jgi:hypothetical protein